MSKRRISSSDYYGPITEVRLNGTLSSHYDEETGVTTVAFPSREITDSAREVLNVLFPNTGERLQELLNIEVLLASAAK